MGLKRKLKNAAHKLFGQSDWDITQYTLTAGDARARYFKSGGLNEVFFSHQGRIVHKWIHYLDIYERHLSAYRGASIKMLEIGVGQGGSLEMWRDYFGPGATIFGIDINPECARRVDAPNQVRIGSQADPKFLLSVVDEMGTPDVILDDGSHIAEHQRSSFNALFPRLRDGGLYIIEDLHTAYFHEFQGGYRHNGTAIEFVKTMIDDMHAWYHTAATTTPAKDQIRGIHTYDSIVVIEKQRIGPPHVVRVGSTAG